MRRNAAIWLLALFVALQSLIYPEITFIDGNMQNAVVDLATALVERRSTGIGEMYINSPDVAQRDGKFYSGMAPGVSWLAAPIYAVARGISPHLPGALSDWIEAAHARALAHPPAAAWPRNIYFTPFYRQQIVTHMLMTVLFGFAAGGVSVLLIYRLMRGMGEDKRAALWAAAIFALGTPMLWYNASYYTQSVALLWLLLTLNLLFSGQVRAINYVLAAFCAALSGACDYPFFIYAGLVLIFGLYHQSLLKLPVRGALMLCGGLAPLVGVLCYHHAAFGGITHTAYEFRYGNVALHAHGLAGIALPRLQRLAALIFSPNEGILLTAPVLLLGIAGIKLNVRERCISQPMFYLCLLLLCLSMTYFCSIAWNSDMAAYGPRFFLPGLLMLALFSGTVAARLPRFALVLSLIGYFINHYRMIGLISSLANWHSTTPQIYLWPITQTYPFAQGLLIDFIYLITIGLTVFGLWLGTRKWSQSLRQ